eukprot:TRINITY_DN3197_c0_g1_i2.p1 TRINITY_DN3197_c0_g1~~TRINITY_DN3197_c0_g1_i2.p1  ORF type:complete len:1293 (-),score=420.04 TRINITY_DN3197_c0_g1_i2:43-3582(-)
MVWSRPRVLGTPPPPVCMHSAVLHGESMYVFGGLTAKGIITDTYCFANVRRTWTWTQCQTGPVVPPARFAHTCCAAGQHIYLFGGRNQSQLFNDLWCFDTSNTKWSQVNVSSGIPPPTFDHACCLAGGNIIVWGGETSHGPSTDVYALDVQSRTWCNVTVSKRADIPAGRVGHTLTEVNHKLYLLGGNAKQGFVAQSAPYFLPIGKLELTPLAVHAPAFTPVPARTSSPSPSVAPASSLSPRTTPRSLPQAPVQTQAQKERELAARREREERERRALEESKKAEREKEEREAAALKQQIEEHAKAEAEKEARDAKVAAVHPPTTPLKKTTGAVDMAVLTKTRDEPSAQLRHQLQDKTALADLYREKAASMELKLQTVEHQLEEKEKQLGDLSTKSSEHGKTEAALRQMMDQEKHSQESTVKRLVDEVKRLECENAALALGSATEKSEIQRLVQENSTLREEQLQHVHIQQEKVKLKTDRDSLQQENNQLHEELWQSQGDSEAQQKLQLKLQEEFELLRQGSSTAQQRLQQTISGLQHDKVKLQADHDSVQQEKVKLQVELESLLQESCTGKENLRQVVSLQQEKTKLLAEKDSLRQENNKLREEQHQRAQGDIEVQRKLNALQKENNQLREELQGDSTAQKTVQGQISSLQQEKAILQAQHDSLQHEREKMQAEMDAMQQENSARVQCDSVAQLKFQQEVSDLQQEKAKVQVERDSLLQENSGLREEQREQQKLQQELGVLHQEKVKLQQECAKLEEDKRRQEHHAQSLQEELSKTQQELVQLKVQHTEQQESATLTQQLEWEKQRDGWLKERQALQDKVTKAQQRDADLEKAYAALAAKEAELVAEHEQLLCAAKQLADCAAVVKNADLREKAAGDELACLKSSLTALQAELEQSRSLEAAARQEVTDWETRFSDDRPLSADAPAPAAEEREQWEAEKRELESKVAEAQQKLEAVQQELRADLGNAEALLAAKEDQLAADRARTLETALAKKLEDITAADAVARLTAVAKAKDEELKALSARLSDAEKFVTEVATLKAELEQSRTLETAAQQELAEWETRFSEGRLVSADAPAVAATPHADGDAPQQQPDALKLELQALTEDRDQWRALSEQIETLGAQAVKELQERITLLEADVASADQKNEQLSRMLKVLTNVKSDVEDRATPALPSTQQQQQQQQ